ncbi:MAG: PIN domain-containing protein [Desulfoplanes sp.]
MQMLINDANILIDIEAADLVEKIFKLPFTFCMPDMLYHDELGDTYAHFLKHGLHLLELSAQSILFTMELDQKYKRPSRYDCLTLALAVQENCPLLTGDQALRKAAEETNITVHGMIWLVEKMIEHGQLTSATARQAYQKMKQAGSRLPWEEAFGRLDAFDSQNP